MNNKVLILSDSHGLTDEIDVIKARHNVEVNIHCGDSELAVDAPYLAGFQTVRGNCDWRADFPEELLLEVGGIRIYVTHGHLYQVKSTLTPLQLRAKEVNADIVCFGHSHIAYAEEIDNQLLINPGSIRLPQASNIPTYVMIEWENEQEVQVTFYSVNGESLQTKTLAR